MNRRRTPSASRSAHRGIALVVVMLILLVVTVLGVGGAQIALLSERTARYDRDYLIASQAAEAALMDAEFDLRGPGGTRATQFALGNDGIFVSGCSSSGTTRGLCLPYADTDKPIWARVDFLDTSTSAPTVRFGDFTGRSFDAGGGIQPVRRPRYIIELIDDQTPGNDASAGQVPKMYRVTAMGFGPRVDVQVVLQMVFRKEKG